MGGAGLCVRRCFSLMWPGTSARQCLERLRPLSPPVVFRIFVRMPPACESPPDTPGVSAATARSPGRSPSPINPPCGVRFRLPLTPPQAVRSPLFAGDMTAPASRYKDVGTKDPAAEPPALGRSASRWTRRDLDLLGVQYQHDDFDSIDVIVEDREIPHDLRNGSPCIEITDWG